MRALDLTLRLIRLRPINVKVEVNMMKAVIIKQ